MSESMNFGNIGFGNVIDDKKTDSDTGNNFVKFVY